MLTLTRSEATEFVRDHAELFSECAKRNPFSSPQWVLHFLDQVAQEDWKILVPARGGLDAPFMLLYSHGQSRNKLAALTNYYASLYSPILGRSAELETDAVALVQQLGQFRPRIASVNLSPMEGNSPDVTALRKAFASRGWYTRRYFCFGNWYLPCEGMKFTEYMQRRDSRIYNTWLRKSKKFRAGGDARLEVVTAPSDVERAMDAYQIVYAKSWKKPEPFPDFVRGWAGICAREGWLRLGIAWLNDQPIAAQFWFTVNRRAYIFKLAYDEDYGKLSAGTVLSAELFRLSIDVDEVSEIDYLTGDDPYKRSWMSHRRERTGLIACNPATPTGFLQMTREAVGQLHHRFRSFPAGGTSDGSVIGNATGGANPISPAV